MKTLQDSRCYVLIQKANATTLTVEFPKAIYIPKHTLKNSDTHIILDGSHISEYNGKRFDVKTNRSIYLPGKFVHEAWIAVGSRIAVILEDGWSDDWLNAGLTKQDLGKAQSPPR